ncbi:hypothetical protein HC762_00840 [bacterium]|nr:hypothetical protein [bacterium]
MIGAVCGMAGAMSEHASDVFRIRALTKTYRSGEVEVKALRGAADSARCAGDERNTFGLNTFGHDILITDPAFQSTWPIAECELCKSSSRSRSRRKPRKSPPLNEAGPIFGSD